MSCSWISKIKPELLGMAVIHLESSMFWSSERSTETLLVHIPSFSIFSFLPSVILFMHSLNKYLLLSPKHGGFSGDQGKLDLCLYWGETDNRFPHYSPMVLAFRREFSITLEITVGAEEEFSLWKWINQCHVFVTLLPFNQ